MSSILKGLEIHFSKDNFMRILCGILTSRFHFLLGYNILRVLLIIQTLFNSTKLAQILSSLVPIILRVKIKINK